VDVATELERLMPVLESLLAGFPQAVFSVDTWRAKVAGEALKAGAHIINDITAGVLEPEILNITSKYRAPYIAMHMLGTPGNMPVKPEYRIAPPSLHKRESLPRPGVGGRGGELEDVAGEVLRFLVSRLRDLQKAGISDIILDPGFGFGKTIGHNFQLLQRLEIFQFLEMPVLVGLSRKSMVWRTLNVSPEEALTGTTALHMIALQKGVNILRVHDVRAAMEVISMYATYRQA
jgi:dihydropteroate synthase